MKSSRLLLLGLLAPSHAHVGTSRARTPHPSDVLGTFVRRTQPPRSIHRASSSRARYLTRDLDSSMLSKVAYPRLEPSIPRFCTKFVCGGLEEQQAVYDENLKKLQAVHQEIEELARWKEHAISEMTNQYDREKEKISSGSVSDVELQKAYMNKATATNTQEYIWSLGREQEKKLNSIREKLERLTRHPPGSSPRSWFDCCDVPFVESLSVHASGETSSISTGMRAGVALSILAIGMALAVRGRPYVYHGAHAADTSSSSLSGCGKGFGSSLGFDSCERKPFLFS